MASSLGCLTDSLPQLNTSFLQLQVRVIALDTSVVVLELPDKTNSVQTHPPKIATAEKSKHVASANPSKPAGNVKSVIENSALLIFKNPEKFVENYFGQNIGSVVVWVTFQSSTYKSAMNRITSTKSNIPSPSSTISVHGNLAPSGEILGGTHCQERQRAGCGHAPMARRLCTRTQLIVKFFYAGTKFQPKRPTEESKTLKEGNDYPSDDMLGIGDVETSPSPVVNRNVSVNTKDCTADGMVVGETTETNAPSDPC
ncbi:hypothetical protein Bca4012_090074 [Brassica carinata]